MSQPATVIDIREYTNDRYQRERAEIHETYGESSLQAAAKRDQALAALFYRSGWTQERLAKAERKSRQWVTVRLRFGQFLAFATTVADSEKVTFKLTEGRFRDYWSRTEPDDNDRQRFAAVIKEMAESTPTAPPRKGLGRNIVEHFGDGKWHKLETIATHVGEPAESLTGLLSSMAAKNNNWNVQICEKQKVGAKDGTWRYRIVMGGEKIDLTALTQELSPILEELEYQGAQHRAAYSPSAVLQCAHRIRKLLEALAQPTDPSR